ncbi:hypothetical protein [Hyphomicrobium sp. 2TAF46]|uniref:hypothetical protein n=1 Tax=Hyphomicrobium sp. 2TAF46 TaxID=3233019 RepID=UPI003F907D46
MSVRSQQAMGQRRPSDLSPPAKPGSGQMAIVINLACVRRSRGPRSPLLGGDAAARVFINACVRADPVASPRTARLSAGLDASSHPLPDRPLVEEVR